jgi:hypothetical protein
MSDAQCQTYPHVADAELRRILEAGIPPTKQRLNTQYASPMSSLAASPL